MPRRRRRRPNWPARLIILGGLTAFCGLLFIPPMIEFQKHADKQLAPEFRQLVMQQLAHLLGIGWFCFLGASVGSFMNVVVWRVPRGRTLFGRSVCPWCAARIKNYDNLPILGWVLLRGRCRACHLPISKRYPLVELLTCLVFAALLAFELLPGGTNLPGEPRTDRSGVLELVFTPHTELLGLYFFHAWMMFHLISWSLIRWDKMRIPTRYAVLCLLAPLACAIAFPWLHPVAAFTGPLQPIAERTPWANQALTGLTGLILGALLGNEFDMAWSRQKPQASWFLALAGVHLGWQASFAVAMLASVFVLAAIVCRQLTGIRRDLPIGVWIAWAAFLQLIFWRDTIQQLSWWPGPDTKLSSIAIIGLLVVISQFAIRRFGNQNRMDTPVAETGEQGSHSDLSPEPNE